MFGVSYNPSLAESSSPLVCGGTWRLNPELLFTNTDRHSSTLATLTSHPLLSLSSIIHPLYQKINDAISLIDKCLTLFTEDAVALSFNGGKDSTVTFFLMFEALARRWDLKHSCNSSVSSSFKSSVLCPDHISPMQMIRVIHFNTSNLFIEELEFLKAMQFMYKFQLIVIDGKFQQGILSVQRRFPVKAMVVGTRKSDPHSAHLNRISMSSDNWPVLLRILPILDWTYSDIWTFLRQLHLPYCSLYERGYTSIGDPDNSFPHPALLKRDGGYLPGWCLPDDCDERLGRKSTSTYAAPSSIHIHPPPSSNSEFEEVLDVVFMSQSSVISLPLSTTATGISLGSSSLNSFDLLAKEKVDSTLPSSSNHSRQPWSPVAMDTEEMLMLRQARSSVTHGFECCAIILVEQEILLGKIIESNSHFLLSHLRALGVTVKSIVTTGHDKDMLIQWIRFLTSSVDFIIVVGGLGSSSNDITIAALSECFSSPLVSFPALYPLLMHNHPLVTNNTDTPSTPVNFLSAPTINDPQLSFLASPSITKLHHLPSTSQLFQLFPPPTWPLIFINNVYVFPGSPGHLRNQFLKYREFFRGPKLFLETSLFLIFSKEYILYHTNIDTLINEYKTNNNKNIDINIYPMFHNNKIKSYIHLLFNDKEDGKQIYKKIISELPKGSVYHVDVDRSCGIDDE